MSGYELDDRSLKILCALVEAYIEDGHPVGSKVLAQRSRLQLSAATIRNIMADLEAAGYLTSPHTSSGRVPTSEAYRLFVDHLVTTQSPQTVFDGVSEPFFADQDENSLAEQASHLLSNITQLTGVVMLPKHEQLILRQVEFLPLSEKRVLVILIINDYEVQNRVIHPDRQLTRSELEKIGNYLTQHFTGQDLLKIRKELLVNMEEQCADLESMLKIVMEMAELRQQEEGEYVLAGETNLFNAVSSDEYHRLQSLFEAFSQKRDILHLLDRALDAEGIQIFIGKESGYDLFADYSLVTASYSFGNHVVGVLGVIGPTRMPYDRVISAVDLTAKLLSQA